jgi:hypothetical protein
MLNIKELINSNIHSSFDYLDKNSVGICDSFEEVDINNQRFCILKNKNSSKISLILRAPTIDICNEVIKKLLILIKIKIILIITIKYNNN